MANISENRILIILISMIWGFVIALIFRQIYFNSRCVVVTVNPIFTDPNSVIYDKQNHKCTSFQKQPVPC